MEGLADNHRDLLLAVPRNCPHKIKSVRGDKVENVKSALCGLYHSRPLSQDREGSLGKNEKKEEENTLVPSLRLYDILSA